MTVILLLGCGLARAQFTDPAGYNGSLNTQTFIINPGDHWPHDYDPGSPLSLLAVKTSTTNRQMEFQWEFAYGFEDSASGSDGGWNKLNLITFVYSASRAFCTREYSFWEFINPEINFKIQTGWRYNVDRGKMELGLFYHANDYWVAHYMRDANEWSTGGFHGVTQYSQMHLGRGVLGMAGSGRALGIRPASDFYTGTRQSYLRKVAYHGGTRTAPQKMQFNTHHIRYDGEDGNPFSKRFNESAIQQWNLTNFRTGDSYGFHAAQTMIGSADLKIAGSDVDVVYKCADNPDQRKAFCIVDPGASIWFVAGHDVLLKPGFHAKKGSNFHAAILPKYKNSPTPVTPFTQDEEDDPWNPDASPEVIASLIKDLISSGAIEEHLIILPNPADRFIRMQNLLPANLTVEIYSSLGAPVQSFQLGKLSQQDINSSELGSGLYIARLSYMGETVLEKKIIVRH